MQKWLEGIAKLLFPKKLMILRLFASDSVADTGHSTKPTPSGSGKKKGLKQPQKGDFNGKMSFAIPSLGYSVACMAPVFASSLETKPWFGSVWEFNFSSAYTYSRYHRVEGASVQLRHPSNDQLLRFDLGISPAEMWDLQAEVEFVNTPRQSFSYRSAAVQARVQWLNDIAGDPVSWTTGFNIREVSDKSLRDVSCPYHAIVDFELNTAIGKEWSKGPYWNVRTWGNIGLGIANEGYPWLRGLWVFEKNWDNHHRAIVFADGYFGFGTKQHVNVDHFNGWAKFHHQSIDLGLGYQYHFDLWGDITVSYARRVYAHTFPEQVNFFTIAYQIPFSVL